MAKNNYFPYKRRDDAVEEYKSLRNEIVESQKQRIFLLQFSLIFIMALFGYLFSDKELSSADALFLVVLTIAPSLFSYSTRCRERRIAKYLEIFLGKLTPWSGISSDSEVKLKFFQRSSTTIVFFMILLDFVFLVISCPLKSVRDIGFCTKQLYWDLAIIGMIANIVIAIFTARLPKRFKENLEALYKNL